MRAACERTVRQTSPRGKTSHASARVREERYLRSDSARDVREFQKKLHSADLDWSKKLLELFEGVREMRHGSDDPKKIEERKLELETMEKGEFRAGIGWVWNGHSVPEPHTYDVHFQRRKRIVSNGTWNPARKGWEYQGEFFGVWE